MTNNYIIYNGELYHAGVKGMKWGVRKARPTATGTGRRGRAQSQNSADMTAKQQARKRRAKTALKIGAAAAGTAIAAYGAYRLAAYCGRERIRAGRESINGLLLAATKSVYGLPSRATGKWI